MRRALLAALLALAVLPGTAHAGRLQDAGAALAKPGVWVDDDLRYLLTERQQAALTRRIRAAGVPLRVALVPQTAADESVGDSARILGGIVSAARADGLYVLVDGDAAVEWGARRLTKTGFSEFGPPGSRLDDIPVLRSNAAATRYVSATIDRAIRALQTAPDGPPESFAPASDPKDYLVPKPSTADNADGIVVVGFIEGLLAAFVLAGLVTSVLGGIALAVQRSRRVR